MLKYNNTHIFTGYLKQLLSSFHLPTCQIYTHEFAKYLETHGKEDPRILDSFDELEERHLAVRINYLKNNEIYHYFRKYSKHSRGLNTSKASWQRSSDLYYDSSKLTPGLTKTLNSPGINYDTKTHEYLGDYLRFLRDYHNLNLMSLYNCFTNKLYNNVYFKFPINPNSIGSKQIYTTINTQDPNYRLYAVPAKLFADYTIAIDCDRGVELFCGFYNTQLDLTEKAEKFAAKTYQRVHKTLFSQPFLYDKLNLINWSEDVDFIYNKEGEKVDIRTDVFTRWDIINREKDLKLFIKVPVSCRSTITILEGDYRTYNDVKYSTNAGALLYQNNHSVLNFNTIRDKIDLNDYNFKPISRLQLLAFNNGESYPFADRLIEYLGGSAITQIDEIPDNIKRVQQVMNKNNNYFKIAGLWENKMQNILYDYMMNSGPFEVQNEKLKNRHSGNNPKGYGYHGHNPKSTQFDILGYVDKDTEKLYVSWKKVNNKATIGTSLQTVDIYDGLYDI